MPNITQTSTKNFNIIFKNKYLFENLKKKLKSVAGQKGSKSSLKTKIPSFSSKKTLKVKFSEKSISINNAKKILGESKFEIEHTPHKEVFQSLSVNKGYPSSKKMVRLPKFEKLPIDLSQIPSANGFTPRDLKESRNSKRVKKREFVTLENVRSPNTSRSFFKVFSNSQSHLDNSQIGSNDSFLTHLDKRFTKLKNYATRLQSPKHGPSKAQLLEGCIKMQKIKESNRRQHANNSNYIDNTRNLPLLDMKKFWSDKPEHRNTKSKLEIYKDSKIDDCQDQSVRTARESDQKFLDKKLMLPDVKSDKFKLILDPFKQVSSFRRLKKSDIKGNIKKILLKKSHKKSGSSQKSLSISDFDLFEAINKVHRIEEGDRKHQDFAFITKSIEGIVKDKIKFEISNSKFTAIIDSISKSVTTRVVFKNELLFSGNEDVSGVYVLLDGKIGVTDDTASEKITEKLKSDDTNIDLTPLCNEIITEAYTFICEAQIAKEEKFINTTVGLHFPFSRLIHIPKRHYLSLLKHIWDSFPERKGKYISEKSEID
ncbi:unnamed protein product [Moneuplotes crassus]|uniref:Cyclic nucleotide-binding domain-containing protein n=1 Tax=Euplotes crassus TaxID=5936 RepID=A0AAD1X6I3_EUPCR|nr:unnamed protein product [Moneuplotes crassus]